MSKLDVDHVTETLDGAAALSGRGDFIDSLSSEMRSDDLTGIPLRLVEHTHPQSQLDAMNITTFDDPFDHRARALYSAIQYHRFEVVGASALAYLPLWTAKAEKIVLALAADYLESTWMFLQGSLQAGDEQLDFAAPYNVWAEKHGRQPYAPTAVHTQVNHFVT